MYKKLEDTFEYILERQGEAIQKLTYYKEDVWGENLDEITNIMSEVYDEIECLQDKVKNV